MVSAVVKAFRSGAASSRRRPIRQRGGAHIALRATTQHRGSAVIVSASGEVDASNEDNWANLVSKMAASAAAPGPVVIDVSGLEFMGSCAFAVLAQEAARCRRRGVRLCLVSQQPIVARTAAACGLGPVLSIHPTIDMALQRRTGVAAAK